jgi:hypothetical protein
MRRKTKEGEKERQAVGKTRKSKRIDSTSTSQLRRHCFHPSGGTRELFLGLLFHFLQNRICRCFFPSAPAARTLRTLTFFSLLTPARGKCYCEVGKIEREEKEKEKREKRRETINQQGLPVGLGFIFFWHIRSAAGTKEVQEPVGEGLTKIADVKTQETNREWGGKSWNRRPH